MSQRNGRLPTQALGSPQRVSALPGLLPPRHACIPNGDRAWDRDPRTIARLHCPAASAPNLLRGLLDVILVVFVPPHDHLHASGRGCPPEFGHCQKVHQTYQSVKNDPKCFGAYEGLQPTIYRVVMAMPKLPEFFYIYIRHPTPEFLHDVKLWDWNDLHIVFSFQ